MATGSTGDLPNVSNRILLVVDFQIYVQLLKDLYSVFTHALSKASNADCVALIRAQFATLGIKLRQLPVSHGLDYVNDIVLQQLLDSLNRMLQRLNTVISDSILRHMLLSSETLMSYEKIKHARLVALRDLISLRYKAHSTSSMDISSSSKPNDLSDEALSLHIHFNQSFENEREVLMAIASFVATVESVFMKEDVFEESASGADTEDEGEELLAAKQAQEFCDCSTRLFDLLSTSMRSCETVHDAKIQLSGFNLGEQAMTMLLSTCTSNAQATQWHPTTCREEGLSFKPPLLDTVCDHLRKARKRRRPMNILFNGDAAWTGPIVGSQLKKEDLELSHKTLNDLFHESEASIPNLGSRKPLKPRDKRRLQCLLAQSLLFLFQSRWVQGVWDLRNITFTLKKCGYDITRPYVSCSLGKILAQKQQVSKDQMSESDIGCFMIHFGLLLLQIECGRELELSEEEKAEDLGHELALDRYLEELKGDFENRFQQVMQACLDFEQCIEQICDPRLTDELKLRLAISQHILKPLEEALAFSYPDVAAEISTSSAQPERKKEIIQAKRTSSSQHNKHHQVTHVLPITKSPEAIASSSFDWPSIRNLEAELNVGNYRKKNASDHFREQGRSHEAGANSVHIQSDYGGALPCQKLKASRLELLRGGKALLKIEPTQASRAKTQSVDGEPVFNVVGPTDPGEDEKSPCDSPIESETVFDNVRVLSTSDLKTVQNEADRWFTSMAQAHKFLENYRKRPLRAKDMVKIGILDTGIDLEHSAFKPFTETGQIHSRFCKDFTNPEILTWDNHGHGTHCAHTILKVCNTARLYVGKVFENDQGNEESVDRIVKAIEWLAGENVDIISMSFAFSKMQPKINRAIKEAIGHHDMLFFAAASNNHHYLEDPVGHPAQMKEVIRANSCTYNGNRSGFSPRSVHKRENALSTIGEEIWSAYSQPESRAKGYKRLSGTSMATAVMAGSAALVIEFAKRRGNSEKEKDFSDMEDQLHSSDKMMAVFFHCMSGKEPSEPPNYNHVRPWCLFNTDYEDADVVGNIKRAIRLGI